MKTLNKIFFLTIILLCACNKDITDIEDEQDTDEQIDNVLELPGGFCIVTNDEVVINQDDIERYDYSNHLIYMKKVKAFPSNITDYGNFTVFVDNDSIYSGQLFPPYASLRKTQPTIFADGQSMYKDYIVSIDYLKPVWDSLGNIVPDPREDDRIIEALKKRNQFREGLSCKINSVKYFSSDSVIIDLVLNNKDSVNYYHMDINKMGINLFHYYTHGLIIKQTKNSAFYEAYRHKMDIEKPEPWNTWKMEWLSLIKAKESKNITIRYNSFDSITKGDYFVNFEYPGLKFQVENKEDLVQDSGLVWLGEINMGKEIIIE
jgi:hypothetical protein